jgi:hypothetical protein
LDNAVYFGKERVIPSHADVRARFERRTTLPDKDTAGLDLLAGKPLDAKAFAGTITTV